MSKNENLIVAQHSHRSVVIDRVQDYKSSECENEIIEIYAEEIPGLIEDLQAALKEINGPLG